MLRERLKRRKEEEGIMRKRGRFIAVGFMLLAIVAAVILIACTPAPEAQPPVAPEAPPPAIGMGISERYHEIHTKKLELKCDFCHTNMTETYYDPLAQVSNLADRRACLSCHKEGGEQPFYGEAWSQAKVK